MRAKRNVAATCRAAARNYMFDVMSEDRVRVRTLLRRSLHAILGCAAASGPRLSAQSAAAERGLDPGVHETTINGARLWYRVAGSSTSSVAPVVFLHGGPGGNSYSFSVLEGPRLERSLRMVYFDQRGSGHSERPANRDYALATLVNDVEGLRATLGVNQITLVGHSFGGVLALEYAARYPEHVSHLVLVSAPADVPASCAIRKARLLELHPELRARADSVHGGSDCELEFRLLPGPDHEAFGNAIMFPDSILRKRQDSIETASGLRNTGELSSALMRNGLLTYRFTAQERLTMPVLVVAGGKDASIGVRPQQRFASSLLRGQFLLYDRAGHFVYLDEPDRFARDVVAFLSK